MYRTYDFSTLNAPCHCLFVQNAKKIETILNDLIFCNLSLIGPVMDGSGNRHLQSTNSLQAVFDVGKVYYYLKKHISII